METTSDQLEPAAFDLLDGHSAILGLFPIIVDELDEVNDVGVLETESIAPPIEGLWLPEIEPIPSAEVSTNDVRAKRSGVLEISAYSSARVRSWATFSTHARSCLAVHHRLAASEIQAQKMRPTALPILGMPTIPAVAIVPTLAIS
jgi:hypothetical protein